MSPGKKILYVAGSPGRYIKTKISPGSVNSSIFSLVIICLGAGTVTIPYCFYENGYYLGSFCIIFGGLISSYTGYLIAYCCHMTKASCYEEVAMACYGIKAQRFTSVCMILCNLGFTISYMVLFKSFTPYTLT